MSPLGLRTKEQHNYHTKVHKMYIFKIFLVIYFLSF